MKRRSKALENKKIKERNNILKKKVENIANKHVIRVKGKIILLGLITLLILIGTLRLAYTLPATEVKLSQLIAPENVFPTGVFEENVSPGDIEVLSDLEKLTNLQPLYDIVLGKEKIPNLDRLFDPKKDLIYLTDKPLQEITEESLVDADSVLIIANIITGQYKIILEKFDPYVITQRLILMGELSEEDLPDAVINYIKANQGIAEVRRVEGPLDKYKDARESGRILGWFNQGVWQTDYKPCLVVNVLITNDSESKVIREVRKLEFNLVEQHIRINLSLLAGEYMWKTNIPKCSRGLLMAVPRYIYLNIIPV